MQLTIHLPAAAASQLERLAMTERRRLRDQAALMLERELARQAPETKEAPVTV